ncbi:MAG: hypothetical protein VSS75_005040 [Candidatus Parabeggiatoa sp.]|nr:hypothetical protein [Candidatus Parabeggiatoa sp.]
MSKSSSQVLVTNPILLHVIFVIISVVVYYFLIDVIVQPFSDNIRFADELENKNKLAKLAKQELQVAKRKRILPRVSSWLT